MQGCGAKSAPNSELPSEIHRHKPDGLVMIIATDATVLGAVKGRALTSAPQAVASLDRFLRAVAYIPRIEDAICMNFGSAIFPRGTPALGRRAVRAADAGGR
jgi:hypothetical protein